MFDTGGIFLKIPPPQKKSWNHSKCYWDSVTDVWTQNRFCLGQAAAFLWTRLQFGPVSSTTQSQRDPVWYQPDKTRTRFRQKKRSGIVLPFTAWCESHMVFYGALGKWLWVENFKRLNTKNPSQWTDGVKINKKIIFFLIRKTTLKRQKQQSDVCTLHDVNSELMSCVGSNSQLPLLRILARCL